MFLYFRGEIMGRKDKQYRLNIHQQARKRLEEMCAFGESKREHKIAGTDKDKIFSFSTFKTYKKHTDYFTDWMRKEHPEVSVLKKARPFAKEWLTLRAEQTNKDGKYLSAWTIQTEAKALGKLFGIEPGDPDYFDPPKRNRVDIKRSRGPAERDKHFSEVNNKSLIDFCEGTGLRRGELQKLKPEQLMTAEDVKKELEEIGDPTDTDGVRRKKALKEAVEVLEHFHNRHEVNEKVVVPSYFLRVTGKGGRIRFSPIVGEHEKEILEKIKNTMPNKKVWGKVHEGADIHNYRSRYSVHVYNLVARPLEDIPYDGYNKGIKQKVQKDVYVCRKDEKGRRLDKKAMLTASKTLGHSRIEIIANNYLRNM